MKEFMKTNTVTYNLMSFTGFKSILIFSLLLEGPKSYKELQEILENHEYLHEVVSIDTLRIYLNSLRAIGCKINKITKNRITRYSIDSHPFELKIDEKQAKSILKVYKAISKSIQLSDFMSLQKFFEKISEYIANEDLKLKLKNMSPLNNINPEIIKDLMYYARESTEITILYNSLNSGKKYIDILVDKLSIDNGKLYVYGINSEHKNYSSFLVSRIIEIASVNLQKTTLIAPEVVVGYEIIKTDNEEIEILPCEKIIKTFDNKVLIEMTSRNKFDIFQRVLSYADKCKVLYPASFKSEIITSLKKMKEGYFEQ